MRWQFLSNLVQPREIAGIEVQFVEQTRFACDYVVVQKKSGKLNIIEKSEEPLSLEAILLKLPKGIPLCVVLGGKAVVVKKHTMLLDNIEEALGGLFPNIQATSFAFQHIRLSNNSVVALARLEQVDALIELFNTAGHDLMSIDLAFGSLPSVLPLLKGLGTPLYTNEWELYPSDEMLADFSPRPHSPPITYHLADDAFTSHHLPAFAACLNSFLGPIEPLYNTPDLQRSKKNYQYRQLFRVAGVSFLSLMLIALLVNTFLFFSWSEKLQQQSVALAMQGNSLTQLDSLQSQYNAQRQFLEKNSLVQNSLTSWYADRIGASIVAGIRLTALQVFPTNPEIKKDEKVAELFLNNKILIKGSSKSSALLNEWIRLLQSLPWVKEVKVLPYSENMEGKGEFELQLKIID
jgi:Tfp pilus assembly protein PilN